MTYQRMADTIIRHLDEDRARSTHQTQRQEQINHRFAKTTGSAIALTEAQLGTAREINAAFAKVNSALEAQLATASEIRTATENLSCKPRTIPTALLTILALTLGVLIQQQFSPLPVPGTTIRWEDSVAPAAQTISVQSFAGV